MPSFPASPVPDQIISDATGAMWRWDTQKWTAHFIPDPVPPIGTIADNWIGHNNYAPPGWLLCDGAGYGGWQYPALFSVLGAAYGGDGVTYFHVPDCRARMAIGLDPGEATQRVTGGYSGVHTGSCGWNYSGGNQYMHHHNHYIDWHDHGTDAHSHHTSGHHVHRQGYPAWHTGYHAGWMVWTMGADFGLMDTWGNAPGWDDAGYGGVWSDARDAGAVTATGSGWSQNMPPCIVAVKIIYAGA